MAADSAFVRLRIPSRFVAMPPRGMTAAERCEHATSPRRDDRVWRLESAGEDRACGVRLLG